MCQTLLKCWGDGDEYRDEAFAPLNSLMSIRWRGVRESHAQDALGSALAMKQTEEIRNVAIQGEQGAGREMFRRDLRRNLQRSSLWGTGT